MKISAVKIFLGTIAILVLCLPVNLFCQKKTSEDFVFKQIRIEDGLSQSTVQCMLQDRKGFLWFGTSNGLNRYDGYNFTVYVNDPSDSTSISDNGILSLYEDKEGYLWIGTVEGVLNKFDRKTGKFAHYKFIDRLKTDNSPDEKYFDFPLPFSRSSNRSIVSIVQDEKNFLWIGTWGKGLVKYNIRTNTFEHFHFSLNDMNGLNSNRVKSILPDVHGITWVATLGGGLYKFIDNGNRTSIIKYEKNKNEWSLSDNKIASLMKDKNGDLWIGTYGSGLNKLSYKEQQKNSKDARFEKFTSGNTGSLSNSIITSIIQNQTGSIWIGTFGGGLFLFDSNKKSFYNFKSEPESLTSLSKNDILSLMEDRSGTLWIGTHLGKGLNKVEHSAIKFPQINKGINNKNGLNDDVVWAINEDDNSVLWIGTYKGGLNKFDRKKRKYNYFKSNPANQNSISDNHIRAIVDDQNGNLWIGTYSGGLNKFDKTTGLASHFTHVAGDSTSLGANQVQAILIDHENNFWIGTFGGGLNKLNAAEVNSGHVHFKRYMNNPGDPFSISDNRIYSLSEDSDGNIWIGTFGGGLNKFDPTTERFLSYKNIPGDESSISDNRVMTIYQDTFNNLWIGTYGGGLQKFDKRNEKFTSFNKKNRMNSSVVYAVLEDRHKNLWMSTDNGLFKLNMQTEQFTQYDLHDGLQSLEFSGGAYFKSSKGEMFFGGINGINYFFPDSVKDNKYVQPIVISSFRIFNEPVRAEKDSLELSYSQNFFSFEFSALDYTNPQDNQYAYILEGFDEDWHYVDSRRRIANYTSLPPGEYVFRVRGSNNDGLWNNDGARIYINILPPLWKRWWFITSFILLISFLIFYLSTIRYRSLLAIEKLKAKLAADLHDNIGSGLTEISILSELVSHETKSETTLSRDRLNSISDKARQLIDTMSDIVWMVNPQRDSFYHLIIRLKDTYSDLLNSAGISFQTINLEKLNTLKLPMEYKQNLYLIFKEGMNNAIKHSRCTRISFEASLTKDILKLFLSDDGIGIDQENHKLGNGLLNMKSRARVIGGILNVDSSGSGTTIKFVGKISGFKKFVFSFLR